jgi:hypothetical protein
MDWGFFMPAVYGAAAGGTFATGELTATKLLTLTGVADISNFASDEFDLIA